MEKLTWEDIEKITDELTDRIKSSGFRPDCLIGITTGGLIPLYFLAKKLDIGNILTVSATSYEKARQKELKITYLPEVDLTNKKLLLIVRLLKPEYRLKESPMLSPKSTIPAS